MVNDTLAYGRKHNNTVLDARRIWAEWFTKWGRDANGNRHYEFIFDGVSGPLKMDQENIVNSSSALPVKFALKDFIRFVVHQIRGSTEDLSKYRSALWQPGSDRRPGARRQPSACCIARGRLRSSRDAAADPAGKQATLEPGRVRQH